MGQNHIAMLFIQLSLTINTIKDYNFVVLLRLSMEVEGGRGWGWGA